MGLGYAVAMPYSRSSAVGRRLAAALVLLLAVAVHPLAAEDGDRWLPAMERFAELDRATPPEPGGVLFLGSSSVRMWDLERWLPGTGAVNRGFGGSQIEDSVRFFDRLVVPHAPSRIFFYAGDNDIAAGKSAETVAADYARFCALVHEQLPETRVWYVAIKPSLARWSLWPEMEKANRLIVAASAADPRLGYVDVASPMLSPEGRPLEHLFVEDGLHLNDAGYRLWTDIVAPLVGAGGE